MRNTKLYYYLVGFNDLICFVYGSFLLSLALFGACSRTTCTSCCECCPQLGLSLVNLGFFISFWVKKCCKNSVSCCGPDSKEL